jgi:hypothetical protein
VLALPCFAQLDRGAITGTVTDPSGAVVPGAKIAIRNQGTNVKYESATTGAGDYNAVNLPAGSYELTFAASGLKTLVRSNIVVAVSETVRVDANASRGPVQPPYFWRHLYQPEHHDVRRCDFGKWEPSMQLGARIDF